MPRYGPEAQERIRANSSLSIREFMRLLWPYFWPRGREHRLAAVGWCVLDGSGREQPASSAPIRPPQSLLPRSRVAPALTPCSFVALGLAKACTIVSPSYMGAATDALLRGEFPVGPLVAFALLRFAASAFEEVQRLVYLRVKQVAYHEIAVRTFAHLHSLSLHWHVSKRSGVVLRAMDRGISSAATVVDSLFLRLGPTLIEMAILVALFAQAYNSPGASASIAISSFLYIAVTVCLAQRRREKRMTMHKADNEANQIAVDTLTAFETVKAFNNEGPLLLLLLLLPPVGGACTCAACAGSRQRWTPETIACRAIPFPRVSPRCAAPHSLPPATGIGCRHRMQSTSCSATRRR